MIASEIKKKSFYDLTVQEGELLFKESIAEDNVRLIQRCLRGFIYTMYKCKARDNAVANILNKEYLANRVVYMDIQAAMLTPKYYPYSAQEKCEARLQECRRVLKEMQHQEFPRIEYYALGDGYGIVGYGFKCPSCNQGNEFVDEEDNIHQCKYCHKFIQIKPIKEEM
jgi:hypothetical protein